MNRRTFFKTAAAGGAAFVSAHAGPPAPAEAPRTSLGVVAYSFSPRSGSESALGFLEYCHSLGAGGVQVELDSLAEEYAAKIRRRAEELEMFVEVLANLPERGDTGHFEATVAAARRAGAVCLRGACLRGRRYETFSNLEEWRRFVEESNARLRLALPILEKHRLAIGIENHKDWTADELVALMREYQSEFLGVCLDTGNNIALLDDPAEVIEALAPFAVTTHFKDMAVEEEADGFRLSEVPLGQGALNLRWIVETIRKARPRTNFNLEMITRDPLEIPCLTEKYWATFPGRSGKYLARTLAWVRAHRAAKTLPQVSVLDATARRAREEANVRECLAYAHEQLSL